MPESVATAAVTAAVGESAYPAVDSPGAWQALVRDPKTARPTA